MSGYSGRWRHGAIFAHKTGLSPMFCLLAWPGTRLYIREEEPAPRLGYFCLTLESAHWHSSRPCRVYTIAKSHLFHQTSGIFRSLLWPFGWLRAPEKCNGMMPSKDKRCEIKGSGSDWMTRLSSWCVDAPLLPKPTIDASHDSSLTISWSGGRSENEMQKI